MTTNIGFPPGYEEEHINIGFPPGYEEAKSQSTTQPVVQQPPIQNTPAQPQVVQDIPVQSQAVKNNDGNYTLSTGIQKKTMLGTMNNLAKKLFTPIPVKLWDNRKVIGDSLNNLYQKKIKPTYENVTHGLWHLGGKGLRAVLPKKAALPFLSEDWWFGTDEQHERLNQLDDIAEQSGYYDQNAVRNDFLKGKLSRKQANAYAQLVGERERLLDSLNYINTRAGNTAEGITDVLAAAVPGGEFKGAGSAVGKGIYNATRAANASKGLALGTGKVGRYLTKHTLRGGQIGAEMAVLKNLYENGAGIEHDPFVKELVNNIGIGIAADNILPIGFKGAGWVGGKIGKGINKGAEVWENTANKLADSNQNAVAWMGNRMNDLGNAATEAGALTKRFFTSDLNKINIFGDKVNDRARFNEKLAQLTNEDSFKSSLDPQIIKELEALPEEYTDEIYEALYNGKDLYGNPLEPSDAYKLIMEKINADRVAKGLEPHKYSNGWEEPNVAQENVINESVVKPEEVVKQPNNIADTSVEDAIRHWREQGYEDDQIANLLEYHGLSSKEPIVEQGYEALPQAENPNVNFTTNNSEKLAGTVNVPPKQSVEIPGATILKDDTEALVGKLNELNGYRTNTGNARYDSWIAKNKQERTESSKSSVENKKILTTEQDIQNRISELEKEIEENKEFLPEENHYEPKDWDKYERDLAELNKLRNISSSENIQKRIKELEKEIENNKEFLPEENHYEPKDWDKYEKDLAELNELRNKLSSKNTSKGSGTPVKNETGINTHEQVQTPQNEPANHVSERRLIEDEVLSEPLRESSTPKTNELNRIDNPEPQLKEQPEITRQDIYRANFKTKNYEKKAKRNYKFAKEHVKYNGAEQQVEHLEPGMAEGANTPLDRHLPNRVEKGSQVKDSNGKGDYGDTYDVYSHELSPDEVPVSTKYKSNDVDFNKFYDNYSKNNFKNRAARLKAVKDEIERQGGDRKAFNDVYSKFMEQSEKDYNVGRPKKEGDLPYNDTWTESFMKDMKALSKRYKNKTGYRLPDVGQTTKNEIKYTEKLWRDNLGTNAKMLAGKQNPEMKIYGLLNRKNPADAQKTYDIFVSAIENSNISGRYRDIMINQLDRAADKASFNNGYKIKKQNINSLSIEQAAEDVLDRASRVDHATAGKIISNNKKTLQYANKYYNNDTVAEHYSESTNKAVSKIINNTNKDKVISDAIDEAKRKLKGKWLKQRLEYIDKHKDEIFAEKIKEAERIYEQNKNIIRNHYTDFEASERYELVEKNVKGTTTRWKSEGTGDTWSTTTKNLSDKYKEADAVLNDLESRIQQAKKGFKKGTFKEEHFNTPEENVEYKNWKPVTKSEPTSNKKPLSNEMQKGALHEEEVKLNNEKAALDKEYSKTYADYQKEFGKKAYSKWIKRRQEIRNESKQIENRLEEISKERKEIQQKINIEPSDGGVSEKNIREIIKNKKSSQIQEQPKNTTDVKYTEITNSKGQKVGVHDSGNLDIYNADGTIKKRVNIKENPNAKKYLEDKQTDIFSDNFDAAKTNFGKADRSVGSNHKFADYAEDISNGDSEISKTIKEVLGDEGFSFEEMSGGGRNYADGRVTINSKNPVISQLKSLMHETHHKIAKAIAEMCGKDSIEYKIFQKGEEINNKIHDFESTNPGIVNIYNKIKNLRANDKFDDILKVYKDLSSTVKKYLSDYEDMIDEYYGSIIETEANLAKTGRWQFFGKDIKHYAQRLKEFNNRRLKGNKSQIEGNNNRTTTERPRTDGSMEDKGQLSGRLGNTSDRQYLEDRNIGLSFLKEQSKTYEKAAKSFDFKRASHDEKYANDFIKDLKKSVNNTENIIKKRLLATDPEILGRLELTGAETYLAPTKYKLNVDKTKLSKSTIKEGIKTFFDDWFRGVSDVAPSYKVKEVFGHKSSSLERKRSLQQQYVNTKMREAKIQSINNVMNEVESMPQTKPIIDGKIDKGYVPIKQGIMSNVLATTRGKDFYHLLERGDADEIMRAFVKPEHLASDGSNISSEFKNKFSNLFDSKGKFAINSKLNPEIMLDKKNPKAIQAYRAARHFIDIAEREKEPSYQVPKYVFDILCSMNNEKVADAFMHYGLTSGTLGRLGATIADFPVTLAKRAFLGLSTGWNIGNRLNNPILLGMQEKDTRSLAKHYLQAFSLKNEDLPPELFDNNLLETNKLRETMANVTGNEKYDTVIGLLAGNTVPKQTAEHFIRKIGRGATIGVRIPTKIGEANMKFNEMFENFERKVAYAKQLDDLVNKRLVTNVSNNIIRQGMALPELNKIVMKDAKLRKYVLDRVYDTLGDFQALTPIEKGMCKRVAIFYSWLRTINRSLYKVASENPTKALMAYKTIQDIKEDDVNHKDFQKGALPIDSLPFAGKLNLTRDGKRILFNPMRYFNYYDTHEEAATRPGSTLNPYITLTREAVTGKSSFDGKNYKSRKYAQSSYYDQNQKKFIDGLWNTETQDWVRDKDGKISNSMPLDSRLRRFGVGSARLLFPSANASLINYEKALDAYNTMKSDDTWKAEHGNRIEPDRLFDDDFGGYNNGDVYRTKVKKNGEVKVYDRYAATRFNKAGQTIKHLLGGVFQEEMSLNNDEKAKRTAKLIDRKLEQENYDKYKRNKYKKEKEKKLSAWKAKYKK